LWAAIETNKFGVATMPHKGTGLRNQSNITLLCTCSVVEDRKILQELQGGFVAASYYRRRLQKAKIQITST
jgi:hypothetical protein